MQYTLAFEKKEIIVLVQLWWVTFRSCSPLARENTFEMEKRRTEKTIFKVIA